jgi:hypothetical protein
MEVPVTKERENSGDLSWESRNLDIREMNKIYENIIKMTEERISVFIKEKKWTMKKLSPEERFYVLRPPDYKNWKTHDTLYYMWSNEHSEIIGVYIPLRFWID